MPMNPKPAKSPGAKFVTVWDPLVRLTHWAMAVGFIVAYASPEEGRGGPGSLHIWTGYVLGAIILLRLVWGFVGPRYARFSDFVFRPSKVIRYLIDLVLAHPRRYLGHSPAGGAMVVALLVCLAASVATGIAANGRHGLIGDLHGAVTGITLALVILHVIGVIVASITHRENLVAAMFTGRKRED
jgi:cytochrome b